jgi:hypothetical protein
MKVWWEKSGPAAAAAQITVAVSKDELTYMAWKGILASEGKAKRESQSECTLLVHHLVEVVVCSTY